MARMLHRPGAPATGRKVFLATPAYGGLMAGYTFALFHSALALREAGIDVELAIFAGDCHVDDSRNRMVRQFLLTDCTEMVFLDADLRWEPPDLVALLGHDRDVVAATYPLKQDDEAYPVRFLPGEIWSDEDGLIEVEAVPTGFLRMRRHVLERLAEAAPKYAGKSDGDASTPLIFERTLEGATRWGGDYTFCRKWRATGGKIFLMPDARLEHTGDRSWIGSVGSYMKRTNGIAVGEGLRAIAEGRETPETLMDLVRAWDNPWAAGADLMAAAIMLARNATGPIIECGSGLTTLVMAAANPAVEVHAIEHDAGWLQRLTSEARGIPNIRLHYAPIRDGWYAIDGMDLPERFALALVDGPPRHLADRTGALRFDADMWLFDDMNTPAIAAMVDRLCAERGMGKYEAGQRPFAIVHGIEEKAHATA